MSKKERKPKWTVSYDMRDVADRMIVDVREHLKEHPGGHVFKSEAMTDRGPVVLEVKKNVEMDGNGFSTVSCSFENMAEGASTHGTFERDSWENIVAWIMDDNNMERLAEALDSVYKHTHYWD